tara:strand:+ start:1551 stop:2015 length:465 start_codon:yes stop_codon:yes gene_type:complete
MESYKDLFKKSNQHHLILLGVLVLYILLNIQTTPVLAKLIDTVYGNIAIVLLAFGFLTHSNPIVGVVALYAAYELIQRSSVTTGSAAISRYLPTEMKKGNHLSAFNQFPITLEEEVVKQMAPLVETSGPSHLHYKPAADDTHDAMDVMDTTSVI